MKNLLNVVFNAYVFKNRPISLIHFITNKCNARCKHCFIDFSNPEIFKNELKLGEIKKLSRKFGNSLININLTGGEPFLRKDIFDIAKCYFKNTSISSLFITTNGMYTEKIKDFIAKFKKQKIKGRLIFSISIDDLEKAHNRNRHVKGLFKNAIKTYYMIKDFNDPDIIPNIAITVTMNNYKNVVKLYEHLKASGIEAFTATIMREEGVIKKIDKTKKKRILDAYIKLTGLIHRDLKKIKATGFGNHLQGIIMNAKNIIVNKIIEKTYLTPKYITLCTAVSQFGVIYSNGDVYPCEILDNFKLGNLRDYDMDYLKLIKDQKAVECKKWIKKTKCNCTFECIWTINVISRIRFIPILLYYAWKVRK